MLFNKLDFDLLGFECCLCNVVLENIQNSRNQAAAKNLR